MIYTAVRLSIDILYWVGRSTIDGVYYVMYGHQDTEQEKINKYIQMLEYKLEEKSLLERKNHQMLNELLKKNNIEFQTEIITEVDDLLYIC